MSRSGEAANSHDSLEIVCKVSAIDSASGGVVAVRSRAPLRTLGRFTEARFINIDLVLLAGAFVVAAVAGAISVSAALGL